jgi:hypothetical protein
MISEARYSIVTQHSVPEWLRYLPRIEYLRDHTALTQNDSTVNNISEDSKLLCVQSFTSKALYQPSYRKFVLAIRVFQDPYPGGDWDSRRVQARGPSLISSASAHFALSIRLTEYSGFVSHLSLSRVPQQLAKEHVTPAPPHCRLDARYRAR